MNVMDLCYEQHDCSNAAILIGLSVQILSCIGIFACGAGYHRMANATFAGNAAIVDGPHI